MLRVISFIVTNQPGVLSRISGLISRRGFNIESLTVGVTSDPNLSRITIVMFAEDSIIEQVLKQFDKLLDVKAIKEIPLDKGTFREIALIKVNVADIIKKDFMKEVGARAGIVLDFGDATATVQLTGTTTFINEGIEDFRQFGIVELARTGMVALESGDAHLLEDEESY